MLILCGLEICGCVVGEWFLSKEWTTVQYCPKLFYIKKSPETHVKKSRILSPNEPEFPEKSPEILYV